MDVELAATIHFEALKLNCSLGSRPFSITLQDPSQQGRGVKETPYSHSTSFERLNDNGHFKRPARVRTDPSVLVPHTEHKNYRAKYYSSQPEITALV